jgi:hypothetical protein
MVKWVHWWEGRTDEQHDRVHRHGRVVGIRLLPDRQVDAMTLLLLILIPAAAILGLVFMACLTCGASDDAYREGLRDGREQGPDDTPGRS